MFNAMVRLLSQSFRWRESVVKPQCTIKHFIMCAADLQAWAIWAMSLFIDPLATVHGISLPCFPVDHQQSGCTLCMSNTGDDPEHQFRDQLEQMVHHSTPVFIIRGCPLPQYTGNMTMLNVTFEPASQNLSIQAYYHVPNRNIHQPVPWIPGKDKFVLLILITINQFSELMTQHSESNAKFWTSVFTTIHGLFPETFKSFVSASTNPVPHLAGTWDEELEIVGPADLDDDIEDGPLMCCCLHLPRLLRCTGVWGIIAGMQGKNVKASTWDAKGLTLLECHDPCQVVSHVTHVTLPWHVLDPFWVTLQKSLMWLPQVLYIISHAKGTYFPLGRISTWIPLYQLWDYPADPVTEGPAQWLSLSLLAPKGLPVSRGAGPYMEQYCQCKWAKPAKLSVSKLDHQQQQSLKYLVSKGYVFIFWTNILANYLNCDY